MTTTKPDLDASGPKAEATTTRSEPVCKTCNGHGMIGGPSYYAPDEGGDPCPDCNDRSGWLCTCGSPSLPGVLHRADRPCYRVEGETCAACNGRGEVGGLLPNGGGYDSEECRFCGGSGKC
jgi:hypothetical protein